MAEIIFTCPQCKVSLSAEICDLGKSTSCPGCASLVTIPLNAIYPGREVAGFILEKLIGKGGMGEVWLAHHKAMERKVALKMLSPDLTNAPEFVERFVKEVKNAAKLEHPNIVTAFDAGIDKGLYYLAMTYVDGIDVGTRIIRDKSIPEDEALKIIRDIAKALDYAWNEFRLLHCDIKPSNIMLDGKHRARLMDLGLSKCLSGDSSMTLIGGVIMGTPHYISPEQARGGKNVDFRSDVYSLGATFYHMVTGQTPYVSETPMGIVTQHITDPLPPPGKINPKLSAQCSALIEIMMAKNPEERGKSWKDVIKNIDSVIIGRFPAKIKEATPLRLAVLSSRPLIITGIISLFIIVILGMIFLRNKSRNVNNMISVTPLTSEKKTNVIVKQSPVIVIPPAPEPIITNPPSVEKKPDNKETWEAALVFAKNNSGDNEKILARFREVKKKLAGTEYEDMAEQEIMRIVNDQLKKETSQTEDIPKNEVGQEKPPVEEAVQDKQKNNEEAESKLAELMDSLVLKLIDNKYEDAITAIKKALSDDALSGFTASLEKTREDIESLANMEKLILDSFEKDIGKEVSIDTINGRRKVIVRDVKGSTIYIEEKSEEKNAVFSAKTELPLKRLSDSEKFQRAAAMNEESRNIYAGLYVLRQQKDYEKSGELLKNTGVLSEAFLKYLAGIQKEKADTEARNEMFKLLRKAGFKGQTLNADDVRKDLKKKNCPEDKMENIIAALADYEAEKELSNLLFNSGFKTLTANMDKIKAELSKKKMPVSELEKLQTAVSAYRDKYGETKFVQDKKQFLDMLLDEAGNSFKLQFGKPLLLSSLKMVLAPVNPGSFKMGDTGTQKTVKLTEPFWIGKYEVTQFQFEKTMGKNPSAFKNPNAPVERVSWNDADKFCIKLTEQERKKNAIPERYEYRLPTEAEWEYCCRAGTETSFGFGESKDELFKNANYCDLSNKNNLTHQDRQHNDSCDKTSAVGKYQPNSWGIYDMHGNVWEWCYDWYGEIKDQTQDNPAGCESGTSRVNRGGAWDEPPEKCASSYRGFDSPESFYDNLGFRIVLAPELTAKDEKGSTFAKER